MTEGVAAAVLRAQANYRAAWEQYRVRQDTESRSALEKAQRELDEVQRAVEEVEAVAHR